MAGLDDQSVCGKCSANVPSGAVFCPECGAAAAGGAAGPVLPGYTIVRTLGRGGAAVVYLARQEALDRQVAIKVLRHDVEEPRVWARFQREARTIAKLSGHSNVVNVFTAGRSEDGHPFLVTEYLDRGSLEDVIRARGALPPAIVARVGVAVADALAAAHGLGILHRDVKPGNVLLGDDGRVKLGDFGIARLLAAASVTTTDVVAFTPEHVAPEVLRGEPDGPASDVYGLGSTLAAALAGGPLFTKQPDERIDVLLSRKLTGPPPPLPPTVPWALAAIVTRTLDLDPAQRPSLTELRRQLAAAASAPPGAVTPPTVAAALAAPVAGAAADDLPAEPPFEDPPPRRRWALIVVPAVLLLVALSALGIALAGGGDDGGQNTDAGAAAPDVGTSAPATAAPTDAPTVAPSTVAPSTAAPSTAAPTTAVPTTAAPTTAPAAVVTATSDAPATTPPAATAPVFTLPDTLPDPVLVPPPPLALPTIADEPVLVSATEAERFVDEYYDAVREGDYETSFSQLTPEFQRDRAVSFEYYVEFWEDNDVEVGEIEFVSADSEQAIVRLELFLNGADDPLDDELTLRAGDDGELLIASERALD